MQPFSDVEEGLQPQRSNVNASMVSDHTEYFNNEVGQPVAIRCEAQLPTTPALTSEHSVHDRHEKMVVLGGTRMKKLSYGPSGVAHQQKELNVLMPRGLEVMRWCLPCLEAPRHCSTLVLQR